MGYVYLLAGCLGLSFVAMKYVYDTDENKDKIYDLPDSTRLEVGSLNSTYVHDELILEVEPY